MDFQYQNRVITIDDVVITVTKEEIEGLEIRCSFKDSPSTRCTLDGKPYYISGFDATDEEVITLQLTPVMSLTSHA